MSRFHQICGRGVTLSRDRTLALTEGYDSIDNDSGVFSDKPLLPGDVFSVKMKEADTFREVGYHFNLL